MNWVDLAKAALLAFLAGSVLYIAAVCVRRRRNIRPAPLDPHIAIATGRGVWPPTPRPAWADELEAEGEAEADDAETELPSPDEKAEAPTVSDSQPFLPERRRSRR